MRWVVMALALAGCYRTSFDPCAISCTSESECPDGLSCNGTTCTFSNGTCEASGDAPSVPGDGSQICAGLDNGLLPKTCFPPGLPPLVLGGDTIDTSAVDPVSLCDPDVMAYCLVARDSITITGTEIVQGARPLVLWSATRIDVSGLIDASSTRLGKTGPGAISCAGDDGVDNGQVGSGGRGGTFGGVGGRRGDGVASGAVIASEQTYQTAMAVALRGGCAGGNGGLDGTASGGAGGGAVYLMAHESITVSGVIHASGAGGSAGKMINQGGGGGGGGAGGLIGLDAPSINLASSVMIALGGGGGSGAKSSGIGNPGPDGDHDSPVSRAGGGASTVSNNAGGFGCEPMGGKGYDGGDVATSLIGGGGGGGGAAGYILLTSDPIGLAQATLRPDATIPPQKRTTP